MNRDAWMTVTDHQRLRYNDSNGGVVCLLGKSFCNNPIRAATSCNLYEADEAALTHNVGQYLWEGIRQGDGVLVIAMPEHQELFRGHLVSLGADLAVLLKNHQLVFADAELTLSEIMAGGQPDWRNFERVIRGAMRRVRPAIGKQGLRAYGEMVGMLWKVRQFAAAIRLEQLWNKLLEQIRIQPVLRIRNRRFQ
jgi:hypothetical protein